MIEMMDVKMVWKILVMSADLVIFAKLLAGHSVAVGLPAIAGDQLPVKSNRIIFDPVKKELHDDKKGVRKFLTVVLNLLLMAIVGVLLVWLVSQWLDVWTRHGKEAVVPTVKGMTVYEAEEVLTAAGFEVSISDSIHDSALKPGQVVDQTPKAASTVKEGCMIYLSINAFTPRQVLLPALTDISYRQARSVLDGLGIKNVKVDTVPSDFKDLVLSVKRDGKRLMAGARVPVNAEIVIEIGAGLPDEILNNEIEVDSMQIDTTFTVEKLNIF